MALRQNIGLRTELQLERLRFGNPLQCDKNQLYNALDCHSANPRGHWPATPVLTAPREHYEICYEILEQKPEYETVGDYLISVVSKSDEGTASLLEKLLLVV